MGQTELLEKIDRELKKEIQEECRVVYILSRIRKVLEKNNEQRNYKYLNFYCNWALHTKLDGKGTVALLSNRFEKDIDCKKDGQEIARKLISNHADFFKLSSLKNDLDLFLKRNHLSQDLVNEKNRWTRFMELLLEIIKECPVEFRSSKKIEKISLKKNKNTYYYKFDLKNCKYKPIIKLKFK